MSNKLSFLIFMLSLVGLSLKAEPKIDVRRVIEKAIQDEVQKECTTCRVQLEILNEEILQDVAVPDRVIADQWKGQTNLILEMGEEKRVVTVKIRWLDDVLVAKKNIKIGDLLSDENLRSQERDVTFMKIPYSSQMQSVEGLISKQLFRRGQVLDETLIKKPLAVRFGQPVKIELHDGALKLSIAAQAKGAGAIGDDIPVFILETGKKINAKIISESLVRVQ